MSGVLERAAGFFLAPAAAAPPAEPARVPPAVRAVVLGGPADAVPLAAALALSLRAASRAPTALVAVWRAVAAAHSPCQKVDGQLGDYQSAVGSGVRRRPATRRASDLAARLAGHGLPSAARGRLAWLAVPGEPQAAAAAVRRASSIVEGPLVTALTGPRPSLLDDLVAEHDIALVAADPETPLARAAIAALTERGVVASARFPLGRGVPRTLALAGLAAPRIDSSSVAIAGLEEGS